MIIVTTNKTAAYDPKVIFCEPNLFKSYELYKNDILKNEYRYFTTSEMSKSEVTTFLENADEPIYFEDPRLIEHFINEKIAKKTLLAPFTSASMTEHQNYYLYTHIDQYVPSDQIKEDENYRKTASKYRPITTTDNPSSKVRGPEIISVEKKGGEIEIKFCVSKFLDQSLLSCKINDEASLITKSISQNTEVNCYVVKCKSANNLAIKFEYSNHSFPIAVSRQYRNKKNMYILDNKSMLTWNKNEIMYQTSSSLLRLKKELGYLKRERSKKLVKNRMVIHLTRPFINSNIALISSDVALESYVELSKSSKLYYVVSRKSKEYLRLKRSGAQVVDRWSLKHLLYLYNCKYIYKANIDSNSYMFFSKDESYRYADLLKANTIILE